MIWFVDFRDLFFHSNVTTESHQIQRQKLRIFYCDANCSLVWSHTMQSRGLLAVVVANRPYTYIHILNEWRSKQLNSVQHIDKDFPTSLKYIIWHTNRVFYLPKKIINKIETKTKRTNGKKPIVSFVHFQFGCMFWFSLFALMLQIHWFSINTHTTQPKKNCITGFVCILVLTVHCVFSF